jgi:hypothetical protein
MYRGVVRPLDEPGDCGQRRFVIALYAQGDAEAKAAAETLVRAEQDLLRTVTVQSDAIQKNAYPTLAHRVGALFDVVRPRIPENWPEHVIYGARPAQLKAISSQLPQEVQRAVWAYAIARRELHGLASTGELEVQ